MDQRHPWEIQHGSDYTNTRSPDSGAETFTFFAEAISKWVVL